MGTIPSSLLERGKIVEYSPMWIEILATVGVWGMGFFLFTLLVKMAIPIELGRLRFEK